MKKIMAFLSLFSSFGTLICCAIPALLVTLGMGASLAATVSIFPQMIWFSENKLAVFSFAALMLFTSTVMRWLSKEQSCPTDPEEAKACESARRISGLVLYISWGMFFTGSFAAFILPIFDRI